MALRSGTVGLRCHPDVDPIQGLIGVETLLQLKAEYASLLDLQIVAFPQEGILKSPGTIELMEESLRMGSDVVGGCPYNERTWEDTRAHIDMVFSLAQRFNKPIDMHADFADDVSDLRFAAAAYIAEKTIDTVALNQAVQQFNVTEGRYPKDLNELVTEKYLPRLPEAPYGMKIVYDANTGTVKVVPK